MSTADSKNLLVEQFPGTSAKEWKRETKYKNYLDEEVRRFRHPVAGVVYIDDDGNSSTDDDYIGFCQASKLKADDFYYCISMIEGDGAPCWAMASLVHRPFFDSEGYMDSIHLGHLMERLFPKDIECNEEAESAFSIEEELPLDELKAKFTAAGFVFSEALDRLVQGVANNNPAEQQAKPPEFYPAIRTLLGKRFPDAAPQYWHMLSRHLNHEGMMVSVLYHYVFGHAWVIEETSEVFQEGWRHIAQNAAELRPDDYLVWTFAQTDACVKAIFVLKVYFDREQQTEDLELDYLEQSIPKALGRLEFHKGALVEFLEQTSTKVVMDALLAQGFGYSEAFRKHIEAECTGE
jgi:hypothetical protein